MSDETDRIVCQIYDSNPCADRARPAQVDEAVLRAAFRAGFEAGFDAAVGCDVDDAWPKFLADLPARPASRAPAPTVAPEPMTVAEALRDERVRRGEMWIEMRTGVGVAHFRIARGGIWCRITLRNTWGGVWFETKLSLADLDAPATLVPASEAP
jgi:hypothetical protein